MQKSFRDGWIACREAAAAIAVKEANECAENAAPDGDLAAREIEKAIGRLLLPVECHQCGGSVFSLVDNGDGLYRAKCMNEICGALQDFFGQGLQPG